LPDPDLTAELDAAEAIVMGSAPYSEHVAVSRMTLYGGQSCEVITVSRTFLIAAIQDARSWCHEMEMPGTTGPTSGKLADYDAALAVLEQP
jgi:hypothetical protein